MSFFRVLALLLLSGLSAYAQTYNSSVVSQRLQSQLAQTPQGFHHVYILLHSQVDVLAMDADFYARGVSLETRSEELITALQSHAETSQRELLNVLHQSDEVKDGTIHPFWITSVIFVEMKSGIIAELSRHPDVAFIDLNPELLRTSVAGENGAMLIPNGREPGLGAIQAPAMWAKGYTGYGRIGYCNDTGIDPSHPALNTKYRGWYAPPSHAWYQPGSGNTTPFDCDEHGTHVTGTMMGLDRLNNDTIGVAFNAQWIGSASLCGFGGFGLTGSLQWALNPDGNASTVNDRPDVINNSWYDPSTQNECNGIYVNVLNSLEAAGIATVFSAGNEGPGIGTITPPHNINTDLVNTFTVGAVNGNVSTLPIASFSSRGPSSCGGTGSLLIKPEVSAPGFQVRSSVPGGGYSNFNGTSMAAPHVSGAVLLLKEAFPYLTGKDIKLALYYTCTDLGEPGEDNTYGQGIINVDAAFEYLIAQGHTPVSPEIITDLLLLDVRVPTLACAGTAVFEALVENGGTEIIEAFTLTYQLPGNNGSHTWTGALAPGERTWVTVDNIPQSTGNHTLTVIIETVNGQEDDRLLNNRFVQRIHVSNRPFAEAMTELGNSPQLCSGSQALLRSGQDAGAVVNWYADAEGGEALGSGEAWLTDTLFESTTFYAELRYERQLGRPNSDNGNPLLSNAGSTNAEGLIFDAFQPFRLESVKVYAETAGLRIIKLRRSDGSSIVQRFVTVPAGESRVELNMNVPVGTNLQLVLDGGAPLYYASTAAGFPYEIPDIARIVRSKIGVSTTSLTRYYFFFDWAVSYLEPCGRTPVTVEVGDGSPLPVAAFQVSDNELTLSSEGLAPLSLTDQSIGAESRFWNFGDGLSSTEVSPNHVYSTPGSYWISLTINSAGGCPASATELVGVSEAQITNTSIVSAPDTDWSLFPNPASREVWLRPQSVQHIRIALADMQGRVLRSFGEQDVLPEGFRLSLPALPAGSYLILLEVHGTVQALPLQVQP